MKFWKHALLAALLVLSLAACGRTEPPEPVSPEAARPEEAGWAMETAEPPEAGPEDLAGAPEAPEDAVPDSPPDAETLDALPEDGSYTTRDDVALYLHLYGHLPSNFITKSEARDLGWSGGSLEPYAPGKSIGGDRFGNYEGLLPDGSYHECDIGTGGGGRGAERIVYSGDGRVYYTGDHYASFELLYGEEVS